MSTAQLTHEDTKRAHRIWDEYTSQHDLSDRIGQAAGIDPETGQIWFGESAIDIVRQMEEMGVAKPLFFMRVGYKTYLRKGGRR